MASEITAQDWTEKYRPHSLTDLVGNGPAVRELVDWARSWKVGSPPLILHGKPGIGKTSAAHALAHDMEWEIVELNASDQRTKAVIERIAGTSSATRSLSGAERKLIILDEADNLHGTADRGGARAIIEIIRTSRQPIVLIANDLYGLAKELKAIGEPVQFRAIQARSIVPRLRDICREEEIACSPAALTKIAENAGGDVRSAVNMLQASAIGRQEVDEEDVQSSSKDQRATIFDLIAATFAGKPDVDLLNLNRAVDDTPDTVVQWIEGNLHALTDPTAAAKAYAAVSRADEWIGLTYRRQYYTLWRYANATMLLGVKAAAGGAGIRQRIMPPSRWRRMGAARKQKAVRASVMQKLSRAMDLPQHTIREEYLTLLTLLIEDHPLAFARNLDLDADELNFFLHDKQRARSVIKEMKALQKGLKKKEETVPEPEEPPAADPPKKEERQPTLNQATLFDSF
ncbi:replication factor C large subunit [Methanofollis fontis]|uniref:replication factor C large subunit n=1 Tax=Methanofollis fontis TaxID=2052832 RepID=UPI001F1BDAC9|nr:replication factor C large subunit [Methanofollis fontis]